MVPVVIEYFWTVRSDNCQLHLFNLLLTILANKSDNDHAVKGESPPCIVDSHRSAAALRNKVGSMIKTHNRNLSYYLHVVLDAEVRQLSMTVDALCVKT